MIRTVCLILGLLCPIHIQLSAVGDESFAVANQKMAEASIYEVVEILNWKDCDFEGRTFKLNDGSTWYAVGGNIPLYSLVLGQRVVIIPMSDAEIAKYRRGIFPSKPHWIILHPQENAMTIKIAHKMR